MKKGGVKKVFLPEDNNEDIYTDIKEELEIVLVSYEDIFNSVFNSQ